MWSKNVYILLVAITTAVTVSWLPGQESLPNHSQFKPLAGPRISMNLSKPARTADRPAVIALAGSTINVTLLGKPKAGCLWQLGYRDTVIGQKRLLLNANGIGHFKLVPPDVRSRAECTLMIITNQKKVSRQLIVFPAARLAGQAKLIKTCRFGIIDHRGEIQKVLKAEKVTFDNLSTPLLQDSFDGGAVFLAGFKKNKSLDDACRRLHGRIDKGMFAVIVNPPVKWNYLDLSRRRLPSPLKAPVVFAKDFGQAIQPADIGTGPWEFVLSGEKPWKMLAWIEHVSKDKTGIRHCVRHPLITVRQIGRGYIVVVLSPQMARPLTDAAGRIVFDELALWILGKRFGTLPGKEKKS